MIFSVFIILSVSSTNLSDGDDKTDCSIPDENPDKIKVTAKTQNNFGVNFVLDFQCEADADAALGRANITVNKNTVPNDPRTPFVTSGLRIGSPAVTRRGFKEEECALLTTWMCDILDDIDNDNMIGTVRERVKRICAEFPVYPDQ